MARSYISGHRDWFDNELWFCGLVGFSVKTGEAVSELSKKGCLEAGLCLAGLGTPADTDISRYMITYKDTYHTYDKKNREYIGEYSISQDGNMFVDDWIVLSKKEKIPGYRSVPRNTLFNLKSGKEIPLNGLLQFIRYGRDFNSMLLKLTYYNDKAKSYFKLILLDLEKGAAIWERDLGRLRFSVASISEKHASLTKADEDHIELIDVDSGESGRILKFNGSKPFFVKGCVCLTNSSTKEVIHHIVEANVTYSKSLVELGCDGSYPRSGNKDLWLFFNDESFKLSIYNFETAICSHYYFPVMSLDNNLNQVLDIRMVENRVRVIASICPFEHAEFNRVFVFEEDELCPFEDKDEFNHWNLEEEVFVGDFSRIVVDGNVSYLIQFEHPVTFSVLYRHLRSLLAIIGSEYGSTTHYLDKTTDAEWGGLIQVDLENQSLVEAERKEIEMLRILMIHSIGAEYAAGADPNIPINIEVCY